MSVTTTENPTTHTLLRTLADYDLHHSGSPSAPKPAPPPNSQSTPSSSSPEITSSSTTNPDWWPEDHRRIPDYRPANPNLDLEQRPDGVNAIERAFISTMFLGVATTAGLAQFWRKTGGKVFGEQYFRWKIGGEK